MLLNELTPGDLKKWITIMVIIMQFASQWF